MGAEAFEVRYRGNSAKEAYDTAVEYAEQEHGHQQGYSGAINSTPGFKDVTAKYKASGKSLGSFINDEMDRIGKVDGAQCICIKEPKKNNNKIKTQVEHIVVPGTKKWVLKYRVASFDRIIGSYNTKGEAVEAARKYTESTGRSSFIDMEKVLEKGSTRVANVTYKKSSDECPGEYIFYGWASC
jgi:hypothetical protein